MLESNTKKWEQSVLERGIEQGIERGIEQGIEKGIGQVADKLIKRGMKNSDIRTITGLSFDKIDNMRKTTKRTNH